jgi:hypothetical protein
MRAARAQYRPSIQNWRHERNGASSKRRTSSKAQARTTKLRLAQTQNHPAQARTTRRRPQPLAVRPNGMHVFGLLTLAGALLTLVLVTALHWQRAALNFGVQEVEMRSALDQTRNEGRKQLIEQRRALSPRETELRSRQAGLAPVKLDERPAALRTAPKPESKGAKPKPHNPAKPPARNR